MATNTVKMILSLKDNASKALKGVGKNANAASVSAKGLGTSFAAVGVAALAAGAAFVKFGQEVANIVNAITDVANTTGIAVDTVQDLQLMARSSGLEIQTLERALYKFNDTLSEAGKNADSVQAKAFAELGLDPTAFADSDEALRKTMAAIDGVADHSDKTRLTMEILGAGSHKMLKTMQKDFEGAAYANDLLNLRMGDSSAEAGEMQAALALQAQTMDMLKIKAFEAFTGTGGFAHGIAVVTGILNGLVELVKSLGTVIGSFFKMIAAEVEALAALAVLDLDKAERKMMEAGKEVEKMGLALKDVVTLEWVAAGAGAYVDFQEAMEALTMERENAETVLQDQIKLEKEEAEAAKKAAEAEKRRLAAIEKAAAARRRTKEELRGLIESYKELRREHYMSAEGFEYHGQVAALTGADYLDSRDRLRELKGALVDFGDEVYAATGGLKWTETQLVAIGDAAHEDADAFLAAARSYSAWGDSIDGTDLGGEIKYMEEIPTLMRKLVESQKEGETGTERLYQLEERTEGLLNAALLYQKAAGILADDSIDVLAMNAEQVEDTLLQWGSDLEDAATNAQELAILMADLQSLELSVQADYDTVKEEIEANFAGAEELQLLAALDLSKETGLDLTTTLNDALERAMGDITVQELSIEELKARKAKLDSIEGKIELANAISEGLAQASDIIGDLAGGDVFGAVGGGLAASGNPYAMAAGAAVEAIGGMAELGALAQDSSVEAVAEEIVASAEQTIDNFSTGIEVFAEILPDLLVMLITELPKAIIKAIPELIKGLYIAIGEAFRDIWQMIRDWFSTDSETRQADREVKSDEWADWFGEILNAFSWGDGDEFQTDRTASYQMGTPFVGRTGRALLHKGESVVPVGGRAQQGAMTSGGPVNINISASVIDRDVIPRLVREIERTTSKYGRMRASFAT